MNRLNKLDKMKGKEFYALQGWIDRATIKGVEILSKEDAIRFAEQYHESRVKEDRINNPDPKLPERGVTSKMLEAEQYVDDYIEKNGEPPTYIIVKQHLNISGTATYARLRRYRHKMKRNK